MHTPDCPPATADQKALRRWAMTHWPKGQPSEVDVSTLPAAGAVSSPLRIDEACEQFPWVGVWGNFQGLRIAHSASESFQIFPGTVFPYPFAEDLFLSADTGGSGVASFAVFTTREAALAFAGTRPSAAGKIVVPGGTSPFPAPSLADATSTGEADPTTTRVGSLLYLAEPIANQSRPGIAQSWAVDGVAVVSTRNNLVVRSNNVIFNDRTGNADLMRQPDSFVNQWAVGSSVSLATAANVIATASPTQNGWIYRANLRVNSATTFAGRVTLYITRSGTKYGIQSNSTNIAQFQNTDLAGAQPIPVLAGDTVTMETDTGTALSTGDVFLGLKRERFAF